jgi:hypothetical protein
MQRLNLLGLLCGFVGVCLVAAAPASAATVTYDFSSNASATGGGDSSTFSGYFTYDTVSGDVTAPIGITVGGTDAGTYDTLIAGGISGLYVATSAITGDQIDIYLAANLNGTSSDNLSTVYWGTVSWGFLPPNGQLPPFDDRDWFCFPNASSSDAPAFRRWRRTDWAAYAE